MTTTGEGPTTADDGEPTPRSRPVEVGSKARGKAAKAAKAERKVAGAAKKSAKAVRKAAKEEAARSAKSAGSVRLPKAERKAAKKAAKRAERQVVAAARAARKAAKAAMAGRDVQVATLAKAEAELAAPPITAAVAHVAKAAPAAPAPKPAARPGRASRAGDGRAQARKIVGRAGSAGATAAGNVLREVADLVRQATEPAAARIVSRVGHQPVVDESPIVPPVASEAIEPEAAAVEPEAAASEPESDPPEPDANADEPEAAAPEPEPAEPEADAAEPEAAAEPEPAEPEADADEPEAAAPEPEPAEPDAAAPAAEPEPEVAELTTDEVDAEPESAEPEAAAEPAAPEPEAEPAAEPEAAEPEPALVAVDPEPAASEPPSVTPIRDTVFIRDVPPGAVVGASIDVGSNSVHLLVGIVDGHRVDPVVDESVFLGLGDKVSTDGFLGEDARRALIADLARFVAIAKGLGASTVTIVGTEPIRRAEDSAATVRAVATRVGVPLYVLDHDEEGLLTLLGVTGGRPANGEVLVVDIGGGSSELVSVAASGEIHATGLQIGSARLTKSLARSDPPTLAELEAMRVEATRVVATAPAGVPTDIVAVGGTASNLLRLLPATAVDRALTRRRIAVALAMLTVERSREAAARHLIRPERARVLPAGAIIVDALLAHYRADRLRVSEEGIREGAILAAAAAGPAWRDRLRTLAGGWHEADPGA
jgi:hypothetical protein